VVKKIRANLMIAIREYSRVQVIKQKAPVHKLNRGFSEILNIRN